MTKDEAMQQALIAHDAHASGDHVTGTRLWAEVRTECPEWRDVFIEVMRWRYPKRVTDA